MKRIRRFICFCLAMNCLLLFSMNVSAAGRKVEQKFSDGSYIETYTVKEPTNVRRFIINKVSGKKTKNYRDSKGKLMWSVTICATFSYNRKSAKCVRKSVTTRCPGKNWKIVKKSASSSKGSATGKATARRSFRGKTVRRISRSVKLSCTASGRLK